MFGGRDRLVRHILKKLWFLVLYGQMYFIRNYVQLGSCSYRRLFSVTESLLRIGSNTVGGLGGGLAHYWGDHNKLVPASSLAPALSVVYQSLNCGHLPFCQTAICGCVFITIFHFIIVYKHDSSMTTIKQQNVCFHFFIFSSWHIMTI